MARRLIAALVGAVLLVGLSGCGRDVPPVAGSESVAAEDRGEPVALSGTTLEGQALDLADYRGKVVVLNSWASWCGPCRDETPAFVDLARGADPAEVVVVGLNVTDEPAAAQAFAAEFDMPYPSIVDADGSLAASLPGVPPRSLPVTVILDREGRVAARIIGATDPLELVSLTAEVLER